MKNRNEQKNRGRSVRCVIAGIIPLITMLILSSQVVSAVKPLPSGEAVLENQIKAMGGREAFENHHNSLIKATMEMPAAGIKASMESYREAPNKMRTMMDMGAMGTVDSGNDGEVTWENSMMSGPKIKEGDEKVAAEREAVFNVLIHWRDHYEKVENVGIEKLNGVDCFKLILIPFAGEPETDYFDANSYLLIKNESKLVTEMGVISVETFLSDYREVDGVLVAFHTKAILMGVQEMINTIQSVEFNVDIPEGTFDLPEEIKALQAKQQQKQ